MKVAVQTVGVLLVLLTAVIFLTLLSGVSLGAVLVFALKWGLTVVGLVVMLVTGVTLADEPQLIVDPIRRFATRVADSRAARIKQKQLAAAQADEILRKAGVDLPSSD